MHDEALRVLVVEDDADLCHTLEFAFARAGFAPAIVQSGRQALRHLRTEGADLVILDAMLPDLSGFEVCRLLRQRGDDVPVLMLTARAEEPDRVRGFEVGADDYVTKPFSVRELVLRSRAVARRRGWTGTGECIEFGKLRLDRAAREVIAAGRRVALTHREFDLLDLLLRRRGRVQSRAQILDDVWGLDADVELRTVDATVRRLRDKLGSLAAYVETVRGVGYRVPREPPG